MSFSLTLFIDPFTEIVHSWEMFPKGNGNTGASPMKGRAGFNKTYGSRNYQLMLKSMQLLPYPITTTTTTTDGASSKRKATDAPEGSAQTPTKKKAAVRKDNVSDASGDINMEGEDDV